ncbi:thioredoxin domain-containing protein [Neocloeon triangulifer]|uniref:thioredoxin domain-containing protein n=1 Tax=Neocloeon triangulifer TaxID=2078957 RepID=UPI00286F9EFC|nr:thioredoxin domain-containing protein [Neocloeon triangulifer]
MAPHQRLPSLLLVLLLLLWGARSVKKEDTLELVSDDDLVNLVRTEKHVVVAFTQRDNEQSEKLEDAVLALREDLVDALGAWVVRVENSAMARLYNPKAPNTPFIVYFRHGVPLLYDGDLDEDLILHTFSNSKEPAVRELNDDVFEHLTQAATGATTGDWFIMFYGITCVDCQRLQATWEAVAAKLKSRLNVARVNMQVNGAATGRRFRVHKMPTFIFFRQGKLYRYPLDKLDVPSLTSFATEWYKNARAEPVPTPLSPFDDLTQAVADWLRYTEWPWMVATGGSLIGILGILAFCMLGKKKQVQKKQKKAK